MFSGWKVRHICAGGSFTWDFLGICSQWWHMDCSPWIVLFMYLYNCYLVGFDLDVYFTQWYILIFFFKSQVQLVCLYSNTDGERDYSPSRSGNYFLFWERTLKPTTTACLKDILVQKWHKCYGNNQSTFIVFKSKKEHRHDTAKAVENLRQYRS